MARAVPFNKMSSPLQIELTSIREALVWCMNSGFNRGEVAVSLLLSDEVYQGPDYFLVKDIRSMLKS